MYKILIVLALAPTGLLSSAHAQPIAIPDASFEINTGFNNFPDFQFVEVAGAGWLGHSPSNPISRNHFTLEGLIGQTGDNSLRISVENGDKIGTTVSSAELTTKLPVGTYAPLTTYTFKVSALMPYKNDTTFARISLLGSNSEVAATFIQAGDRFATQVNFEDLTVTFTTGASGGFVGQPIYVQIALDSLHEHGRPVIFDNLRLHAARNAP